MKYKEEFCSYGTGFSLALDRENPCIFPIYRLKNDIKTAGGENSDTGKYRRDYPCPGKLNADDAFADGILDQFYPVSKTKLCHEVGPVSFDSLGTDHEYISDLLSRIALRNELDDISFSCR